MSLQNVRIVVAAAAMGMIALLFYADVVSPPQFLPLRDYRPNKSEQERLLNDLRDCQKAHERTDQEIDSLNDTVAQLFNEVRYVRQASGTVEWVSEAREWLYGALMIAIGFLGWFRPRQPS